MTSIIIKNIIHSNRRTVSLIINSDATLTVKAPYLTPVWYINRLIEEKRTWIINSLQKVQSKPKAIKHQFLEGEEFLFLGNTYKLKIAHTPYIELKDYLYLPIAKLERAKVHLTDWYKKQALINVKSRTDIFAKRMRVSYKSIKITTATTRWGSCSHDNNLRFNWKLIMAPQEIIDYVVVHELSHINHKNHSQRFWMEVRNYIPDCKRRINWLKVHGNSLNI
jgi:predicted metal-dependent hydrolase